jgi:hypothetical protein
MTTNEDRMTASRAAGYIVGVGLGYIRRHYRIFALLIALSGLVIILASVLSGGVFIGVSMIALAAGLWLTFRSSTT